MFTVDPSLGAPVWFTFGIGIVDGIVSYYSSLAIEKGENQPEMPEIILEETGSDSDASVILSVRMRVQDSTIEEISFVRTNGSTPDAPAGERTSSQEALTDIVSVSEESTSKEDDESFESAQEYIGGRPESSVNEKQTERNEGGPEANPEAYPAEVVSHSMETQGEEENAKEQVAKRHSVILNEHAQGAWSLEFLAKMKKRSFDSAREIFGVRPESSVNEKHAERNEGGPEANPEVNLKANREDVLSHIMEIPGEEENAEEPEAKSVGDENAQGAWSLEFLAKMQERSFESAREYIGVRPESSVNEKQAERNEGGPEANPEVYLRPNRKNFSSHIIDIYGDEGYAKEQEAKSDGEESDGSEQTQGACSLELLLEMKKKIHREKKSAKEQDAKSSSDETVKAKGARSLELLSKRARFDLFEDVHEGEAYRAKSASSIESEYSSRERKATGKVQLLRKFLESSLKHGDYLLDEVVRSGEAPPTMLKTSDVERKKDVDGDYPLDVVVRSSEKHPSILNTSDVERKKDFDAQHLKNFLESSSKFGDPLLDEVVRSGENPPPKLKTSDVEKKSDVDQIQSTSVYRVPNVRYTARSSGPIVNIDEASRSDDNGPDNNEPIMTAEDRTAKWTKVPRRLLERRLGEQQYHYSRRDGRFRNRNMRRQNELSPRDQNFCFWFFVISTTIVYTLIILTGIYSFNKIFKFI